MPAADGRCRAHGRPASENLQGRKPREARRGTVLAAREWQGRVWRTALAVVLWLVWLGFQLESIHAPWPTW